MSRLGTCHVTGWDPRGTPPNSLPRQTVLALVLAPLLRLLIVILISFAQTPLRVGRGIKGEVPPSIPTTSNHT